MTYMRAHQGAHSRLEFSVSILHATVISVRDSNTAFVYNGRDENVCDLFEPSESAKLHGDLGDCSVIRSSFNDD